jgi:signal recognition particle subunit SEC65
MAENFVLQRVPVKRRTRRLPANLPVDAASRDELEQALRKSGYAVVAVASKTPPSDESDGKKRLRAELEALVNEADESEVARLEGAATAEPSDDDLDTRFWGPAPNSVTAIEAVVADLADQFAHRRRLAADSISRDEAAKLLGIAAQSVTGKLESRKLIGIKQGREWRLPLWQFDPDNASGVLPDLDVLQKLFPGGPVSLSRWMTRAQPDFDGRTPREELIIHGSAPVIKVARALTAAGW